MNSQDFMRSRNSITCKVVKRYFVVIHVNNNNNKKDILEFGADTFILSFLNMVQQIMIWNLDSILAITTNLLLFDVCTFHACLLLL